MRLTLRFWRRAVQVGVAAAFVAIPYLNLRRIHVLSGNFLSFNAFGVPLADPLAAAQVWVKSGQLTTDLLVGAGIALLVALALGTVFCSWVCPFGLLSEWVHSLSRRLLPRGYRGLSGLGAGFPVRLALFGAGVIAVAGFADGPVLNQLSMPAWYSRVFQMYVGQNYVTPVVFLLGGVLAVEFLAQRRVWCRYVCPQAMLLIAVSLINPWRLRLIYRPERCVCKKGDDPCKISCSLNLDPKRLMHPLERECNNCGDCYVTCQKYGKALNLRVGPRCLS